MILNFNALNVLLKEPLWKRLDILNKIDATDKFIAFLVTLFTDSVVEDGQSGCQCQIQDKWKTL